MAHQSLYRTHRPKTFAEVVGQEQVTKPLQEAVKSRSIGHAYLFAGGRGLGKTSVARIFAAAIGCHENDIYEIDAASTNSVEDIRALTEGVHTLPLQSPYKVYILDEAHMLSKSAWNAFLKTLEEPPPYALFILATTELEKVPETVQSRCQVFEFQRPSRSVLAAMTTAVANKEGQTLEQSAADLIAMLAEGSYRDALSILQRVISGADGTTLTREVAEAVTGAPRRETVHALLSALAHGDKNEALATIERAARAQIDMRLFLQLVLEAIRATLLFRYAPDLREDLTRELGSDEATVLQKFAGSVTERSSPGITRAAMLAFLTAADRIRYAPIPAVPLELAVLELFDLHEK